MRLPPATIPISLLQACALASEQHRVPLRLLLGVLWVETEWGERSLCPPPYELARALAELGARFGCGGRNGWERVLAARHWGARRIAERPEPSQWPPGVHEYIAHVHAAGQAARIPYAGPIWTIPPISRGNAHV